MNTASLGPDPSAGQVLAAFEVDCGELVPGHRFIARWLSREMVPHPADLVALDTDRLEPPPNLEGDSWVEHFSFPAGTQFAYDDESREALVWRRGQRDTEILAAARRVPAVVLHYELVPGVAKTELDEEGYFDYLVEIEYSVDQPGDWEGQDDGDIDPADAGPSTPGVSGSWPLPDLARMLTFTITGFDADGDFLETPNGALIVDLNSKTATWVPATDSADSPEQSA